MASEKSHTALCDPQTGAKLLTLQEAARYLDYHPYSVYRLVSQGTLKPQKIGVKTLVFLQKELDRYKQSNEWAARKASAKHMPDFAQEAPPGRLTATIEIDLGLPSPFAKKEEIDDFTWERLPIIKEELEERYGKKMKSFEIVVTSLDGSKWLIQHGPTPILDKIIQYLKKKRAAKK
jgi:predicted DNA-binding transcriptional regulator AlpA